MSDREITWADSSFVSVDNPTPIFKPLAPPPLKTPEQRNTRHPVFGWDNRPLRAEQKLENLFHTITHVFTVLRTAREIGSPMAHAQLSSKHFGLTYDMGMSQLAFGGLHSGYRVDLRMPEEGGYQVYAHRVGWARNKRDLNPVLDARLSHYDSRLSGELRLPKMERYHQEIHAHNAWIFSQDLATLRKLYRPPHTHEPDPGTVDWVIKQAIRMKEGQVVWQWKVNAECNNRVRRLTGCRRTWCP